MNLEQLYDHIHAAIFDTFGKTKVEPKEKPIKAKPAPKPEVVKTEPAKPEQKPKATPQMPEAWSKITSYKVVKKDNNYWNY